MSQMAVICGDELVVFTRRVGNNSRRVTLDLNVNIFILLTFENEDYDISLAQLNLGDHFTYNIKSS